MVNDIILIWQTLCVVGFGFILYTGWCVYRDKERTAEREHQAWVQQHKE